MKDCGNCANYDHQSKQHTDVCARCVIAYKGDKREDPSHWKPIPMTNADRIRAMSDMELAKWLSSISIVATRMSAEPYLTATQQAVMHEREYMDWVRWLLDTVEEDR